MFATRISELLRKEDPPFIYGSARYGEFLARELDAYSIDIAANPDEEARGLEAIMIENERVRRHGFTATELERAKANLLTALESAYKKREKRKHDQFCMEYRGHYLTNDPVPGIEFEFGFVKGILPDIDVEEINALPAAWMTKENRVILVAGPEKEGVSHLTEPEALAIVESIESMEVEPYIDEIADTILVKEIPEGSPVVATKEITELDAVEWTLGNGVTVVYRYSDLTKDEVRFTAYSLGGHSLYPIEKLTSAQMVNSFITDFGIGDFDATALKKVLTGKNVSVRPSINRLTEGFSGNCSPDDFETMLQLVYLYFEQPRFEEEAYNAVMQRTRAWLEEAANDPEKAIRDSITIISVDYHPRGLLFDMEYLNSVALETVEEVYLDRLKDASDFKFFFVGYMEPEEARPMIETYLGALRDADRDESWIDHDVDMPEGATVRVIPIKLNEPKSTVHIKYGKEVQHTPENRLYLRIIREVLNIRYIETVREEEGGTYGVGVRHRLSHYPKEKMSLTMQFDCNPDQAEQLIPLIHKEVDSLIDKGPTEGDLAKVVQNLKKQREEGMQQNEFWLGALKAYYYDGINIADPENYERILDEVTVEDIRKAAKEMLEGADTVEITFNPL
jgi:zinc protease